MTNFSPGDNPKGCFNWPARNQDSKKSCGKQKQIGHVLLLLLLTRHKHKCFISPHLLSIFFLCLHSTFSLLVGRDGWCSAPEAVAWRWHLSLRVLVCYKYHRLPVVPPCDSYSSKWEGSSWRGGWIWWWKWEGGGLCRGCVSCLQCILSLPKVS